MLDLLVIGGGYWGIATALRAQESGMTVRVVDSRIKQSGSRNASAICDPAAFTSSVFKKYLPKHWDKAALEESFNWLLAHGGVLTQEYFLNTFNKKPIREIKHKAIYLDSNEYFLDQFRSESGFVDAIEREGSYWETNVVGGGWIRSKKLVIAAGVQTDEVLALAGLTPLGVKPLYGRGLVVGTVDPSLPLPLSVMIRPYVKHTIRPWGKGSYRIGDTAEGEEQKLGGASTLEAVGEKVLNGRATKLRWIEGYRPTLPTFYVDSVAPNLVVATGGHRLGLGLAGLVAKEALRMLR